MRILLLGVLALSLSACSLLYRLPTRQGNVVDPRDLAKLQIGMSRDQVKYVMGTPVAGNPFRDDRWDYLGYYRSPRGDSTSRIVSLHFDTDGKLSKMDGVEEASAAHSLSGADIDQVLREQRQDKADTHRDPRQGGDDGSGASDQGSAIPGNAQPGR